MECPIWACSSQFRGSFRSRARSRRRGAGRSGIRSPRAPPKAGCNGGWFSAGAGDLLLGYRRCRASHSKWGERCNGQRQGRHWGAAYLLPFPRSNRAPQVLLHPHCDVSRNAAGPVPTSLLRSADAPRHRYVHGNGPVEAPSTTHELSVRKPSAWLEGGCKSPREQAMKVRLRELLGRS